MKYLLVVFLVITSAFAEDATDKMETKYVAKMEQYKAEYDARCRKLTEAYVAELKKIQVAETKKGDLDAALKVKSKIKEMEDILDSHIPVTIPKALPGPDEKDPIIGTWHWYWQTRGQQVTFNTDGSIKGNDGSKGSWKLLKPNHYDVRFARKGKNYIHTAKVVKDQLVVTTENGADEWTRTRIK
jgi:hypothetical protein